MNKYLLEIGTEEIPSRLINIALDQLENNTRKLLKEERIGFGSVKTFATPRRLTLIIEELSDKQDDLEELVKGPSKKIAYDSEGNPSRALQGFAKGQGVSLEDIIIQEFKGEEYVYANKLELGKNTREVLENKLADLIKRINFPKSMVWGGKNLKFARPIRWIVSLLNDSIIDFDLEGIKACNITRGHRFLGSNEIEINHVDEYTEKLLENYVIVDQEERKQRIKRGCDILAKERGGKLLEDSDLLDELTNIVEYPTPFIGNIKEHYLELPKEVITTPMKEHQRYYPVVDDKNRLLPYFIAVRNGNKEHIDIVAKGNEKVLDARLEDAKFFYNEDIKKPLEDYVDMLRDIVFQKELGTVYDKTRRIGMLASEISDILEVGEETKENVERATYLAKADLVTKMVYEFTELQGVMGKEYAEKSDENEIVSLAIYEHYLPRFADDELPTTTAGSIASISDKLDTIAGCFAIGIQPTGSQDPYGLRRQSLGIINIILNKNLHVSLEKLIESSLNIYTSYSVLEGLMDDAGAKPIEFDMNQVKSDILDFFKGRIKNMFIDMGIRYDVVDAVLSIENDDISDLLIRAEELNKWINRDELNDVLAAFNRVENLSQKTKKDSVKRELLEEEEEISLYKVYNEIESKVHSLIRDKEYDQALDQMISLRGPIDLFFDNVMVMVDNEEIKNNRLGLIKKISNTMKMICDLSKIVSK
ncbi:glycine--tRNA ligase subunit beta [Sporosalibacterium faouarense]|uniref:glycine--tRNA ligase subunit beta n=1 Tax=Sporosalibacterium faouarense TaxID=516123 RepID=UPI00141C8F73|nr:glycine--tRNA ligase subunit beta [Sporosalibacterium faouarense]MTI49421.1 glycine--tRNA ligase subunit beta [Bacillota bacterium]